MTDHDHRSDDANVDARVEAAVAPVAHRLDDEQREKLRDAARRLIRMTAALAAFPLRNGDEPDSVFRAYRSEG